MASAAETLDGDWLLIGGSAAAAWFAPGRTTEDIDLVALAGTQEQRLALMQFAADSALPIESVNSAGDFFVRRVEGWRENLVPLARGSRGTIFRPNPTLFLLLKIGRLSEVDLDDCLSLIKHCAATSEVIDRARVRAALTALPASDDASLLERRRTLEEALA